MLMHAAHNMLGQELSRLISQGREKINREHHLELILERVKEPNLVS